MTQTKTLSDRPAIESDRSVSRPIVSLIEVPEVKVSGGRRKLGESSYAPRGSTRITAARPAPVTS